MSSDESYTSVRGTILKVRAMSVLFAVGSAAHGCKTQDWIPRSLIHGADERTIDDRFLGRTGEQAELRIMEWKVKALGWRATRDRATKDLFEG